MDPTQNPAVAIVRDIAVPMRDGMILRADLYRPAVGGPWPVLVQRTPYNKGAMIPAIVSLDPIRACLEGFAVLIQDVRGRYKSPGEFYPYRNEAADGYDTVEWVAGQAWCTGRVGVYGSSYGGVTTWQAAIANPPHLAAIVPAMTGAEYCEGWTYRQGALEYLFILGWTLQGGLGNELVATGKLPFDELAGLADRLAEFYGSPTPPPWAEIGRFYPFVREWIDRAYDESYWGPWAVWPRLHEHIAPSLSIGGWFDMFARGTFDLHSRLQAFAGAAERRALITGPWVHVTPLSQVAGDLDFGARASPGYVDLTAATLNWFRRWLVGPEHARPQPRLQAFVMGDNRWVTGETWPPASTTVDLYLGSDGGANGLDGDGRLVRSVPAELATDSTIYRAGNPVRTLGGGCSSKLSYRPGVFDQRPVEQRPDVLVYTSNPLDRPMTIAGSVSATIFASAAEGELDLVVRVVDVAPDGFARNVADGIVRSQHQTPQANRNGDLVAYAVDLGPTANAFAAGHRIRVDVTHSNFPRYDLNPKARDGARHTIGHGGPYGSRITLPVVTEAGW